jgi:hypothetical protein
VADDDDRVGQGRPVFLRPEAAAEDRPDAKHVEAIARDHPQRNLLGALAIPLAAEADLRSRPAADADEPVERVGRVPQVDEVRVRQPRHDAPMPATSHEDEA